MLTGGGFARQWAALKGSGSTRSTLIDEENYRAARHSFTMGIVAPVAQGIEQRFPKP